jgi:hypothetical protein
MRDSHFEIGRKYAKCECNDSERGKNITDACEYVKDGSENINIAVTIHRDHEFKVKQGALADILGEESESKDASGPDAGGEDAAGDLNMTMTWKIRG